jgi:uncharacterized protein (DUF2336 family)
MSAHASLGPELEEVIRRGSPEWQTKTLERITTFFLEGASRFRDEQIQPFDAVFSRLLAGIESRARRELSHRLAPLANAPIETVRRLAHDDDIAVAGPILRQSRRLGEIELVDIAARMGQAHLLAIAARAGITDRVSDVLLRRGDRSVVHRLAENPDARLSRDGLAALIAWAGVDSALAEKIRPRSDLRPRLRALLPETQSGAQRVPATVAGSGRDYAAAQRAVAALRQQGKLGPPALADFANNQQYDETVAALAALCLVPIEVVDRLMGAERPDPVLILCKSAGWDWPIVEAIITLRPRDREMSSESLAAAHANFERLPPMTAQRVLRFWQARSEDGRHRTEDE